MFRTTFPLGPLQPGKYFISTSRRLFRLIVRQSQGRHHLHLSTLNLPKSSSWFGGEDSVREVAVGDVGGDGLSGRVAWLLLDRTIQRWSIQGDGEHVSTESVRGNFNDGC